MLVNSEVKLGVIGGGMRHECPATVCISGCELMVCGCNFLFWMSDDGLGLTLKGDGNPDDYYILYEIS